MRSGQCCGCARSLSQNLDQFSGGRSVAEGGWRDGGDVEIKWFLLLKFKICKKRAALLGGRPCEKVENAIVIWD